MHERPQRLVIADRPSGKLFPGDPELFDEARNSGSLRMGSRSGSTSRVWPSFQPACLALRKQSMAAGSVLPGECRLARNLAAAMA